MEQQKQRVIVYIDGFNFYFGLKHNAKWKKYYWLDIVKLFESFMRPNQEFVAVKYFSAKPDDLDQSLRQNAFFQANKENPKFKLILGKYLKKEITCFRCGNVIHTHEEKETDVRIATQIVADAYQNNCDLQIVVSADSDMIPAIELATEAKHKVFIYFPPHLILYYSVLNDSNFRYISVGVIDIFNIIFLIIYHLCDSVQAVILISYVRIIVNRLRCCFSCRR